MKWKNQCFVNLQQSRFFRLTVALLSALTIEYLSTLKKKEKKIELKRKEFFYNWNSFQEVMNKRTTIDERIEFVDKAKFTNFSLEDEIHERQCMIFTIIASFSLYMRYNNFIKKARVTRIKRKNQCFANSRKKSLFFSF